MTEPQRRTTDPAPQPVASLETGQPAPPHSGDRLGAYRHKRDPARTPEPFASASHRPTSGSPNTGLFVVQQHAARRMHWDLRLEINGVLASWAVPKGPSLDPAEKRLAVRTEDHPLEYAGFEGIIPAGNYGAGAMIVWDRGAFRTLGDEPAAEALARGKLDLVLEGHKLHGRWALVRTKGEGGKNWLLLRKSSVRGSAADLVVAQPASILSGLTVEALRGGADQTAALAAAALQARATRRDLEASTLRPMLADSRDQPFSDPAWVFELKYDGVRVLGARLPTGRVHLYSRTGLDVTATFPEITGALAHLPCAEFILDGEVVALDERGAPSFERLQRRLHQSEPAAVARAQFEVPVVMFCFDLLSVAGCDVRALPLGTRQALLQRFVPPAGIVRRVEVFTGQGEALFAAAGELGLEGIVAKRERSTYQDGRRSRDWLKIKPQKTADVAIVGYTLGKGSRRSLGALMMAWRQDGELVYAGNVGSGLDASRLAALRPQLQARPRATPAFRGEPAGARRDQVFVEPQLVAEVRYADVTSSGMLRQPVFLRLREDKTVADCTAPVAHPAPQLQPAPSAPAPAQPLRLSNLDKVFWPQEGFTKGDLLHYYEAAWPLIEPYLRDRPVVLTRYPDGIDGKSFFQKHAPEFVPDWVETCRIEDTDYFVCNDLPTLRYVINLGCIPLHVWSARRAALDRPDWAILDLDPKGAPFTDVVAVARHAHALLEALGVPHGLKTSGQDGLHVLIPLGGALTHDEARTFAEVLARVIAAEQPAIATVARPLGERRGKVYVDFLQNGFGKTIVAPFSVRPRRGAPVSTPLEWRDVTRHLDPGRFTIHTVPRRFRTRRDPLRAVLEGRADVPAVLQALTGRVT
jgi:bifunctional non-homologous end joining protein LigD